jgi:hypothetical protein
MQQFPARSWFMTVARVLACLALCMAGCGSPAPPAPTRAPTVAPSPVANVASSPEATRAPTAVAEARPSLRAVPITIEETRALPTPIPLRNDLPQVRATPRPSEPDWKFVSITFAVENTDSTTRLVGIAGTERDTTNLTGATLTTPDGTRYKAVNTASTLGLRTATSRAQVNYPVLLSLRPGFRAYGEATDSVARFIPIPSTVVFRVPAGTTDYGTLTIPPLTDFGARQGDPVADQLRRMVGTFEPLSLSGATAGSRPVQYPTSGSMNLEPATTPVAIPGRGRLTITGMSIERPRDYRANGQKHLVLTMQFRNEDHANPQSFDISAQLFGDDGVVYVGTLPSTGKFSSSSAVPDLRSLLAWHGRAVGTDLVPPDQETEMVRRLFLVPRGFTNGVLVLSGDVDAALSLTGVESF